MTAKQAWDQLCRVGSLVFVARSESVTGWNGKGKGPVVVEPVGAEVIVFKESGTWCPDGGKEIRFSNVYRWSLVGDGSTLRLEHLRFGMDHPVLLFDLASSENGVWRSVSPHACRDDCYSAQMVIRSDRIELHWAVTGPKKQEIIDYTYTF